MAQFNVYDNSPITGGQCAHNPWSKPQRALVAATVSVGMRPFIAPTDTQLAHVLGISVAAIGRCKPVVGDDDLVHLVWAGKASITEGFGRAKSAPAQMTIPFPGVIPIPPAPSVSPAEPAKLTVLEYALLKGMVHRYGKDGLVAVISNRCT